MKYDPDSAAGWGCAAAFTLRWALQFYASGNRDAGDRHAALAYVNAREAARRANAELDR